MGFRGGGLDDWVKVRKGDSRKQKGVQGGGVGDKYQKRAMQGKVQNWTSEFVHK